MLVDSQCCYYGIWLTLQKADVGYFTSRGTQPLARAPPPPKPIKPPVTNPMNTVPDDLIQPRDMKPVSNRGNTKYSAPTMIFDDLQTPASMASRSNQKRPTMPEDAPRPPPPAHPNGEGSKPRPRPPPQRPPQKREKGGPNLFIPRKVCQLLRCAWLLLTNIISGLRMEMQGGPRRNVDNEHNKPSSLALSWIQRTLIT